MSLKRTILLPAAGLLLAASATASVILNPLADGCILNGGRNPSAQLAQPVATTSANAAAQKQPFGRFAELHSCELYTGGCTASSEATLEGRYMLRFWKFEGGQSVGVPMAGLTIALLEKGSENIAMPENAAHQAVAYIPQGSTPAQRDAMISWLRTQTSARLDTALDVREVPLNAYIAEGSTQVSAGKDIAFGSRLADPCGPASCGERLWYEPRNAAANFMVEQVTSARVVEPALSLTWRDQGRRTLFTGQFGSMEGRAPAFCGKVPGMYTKL